MSKKIMIPLVIDQVKTLQIVSQETMSVAVEYLSKCNKILDDLTKEKEKLTKPLNETLKEVRARYKPTELLLEEAIGNLRGQMSSYQTLQLRAKQEEETKIASKVATGYIKMETAMVKIDSLHEPEAHITTESGGLKFRTDKKLKIIDEFAIPRKYLLVDEKAIFADLKLGKTIPGAEIELVQTPINSR